MFNFRIYNRKDMRREMKFRVWNGFEMNLEPQISMISTASINDFFEVVDGDVIMQAIGRKDRNGVDIFEGDVLKRIGDSNRNEFIGAVFYDSNEFTTADYSLDFEDEEFTESILDYQGEVIEVIGNIYEQKYK